MSDNKAPTGDDAVTVEIEIAAPPERVFQALVDQKQLIAWWGSEPSTNLVAFDMDARKGGQYRYACVARTGHDHSEVGEQMKKTGANTFECHGEVLELDPPRLAVWSWIANWHDDAARRTIVRWELEPTKTGTRVRVTHSGLAGMPVSRKDYSKGWVGVLDLLHKFITGLHEEAHGHSQHSV